MTDPTPEELDADIARLKRYDFEHWTDWEFNTAMDAITAMRARLAETDALIAAAYEAAAVACDDIVTGGKEYNLPQMSGGAIGCRNAIRAITPSTARGAYSAAIAAAERAGYEAGLQAAAHWIEGVPQSLPNRQEYATHIRSLSAKISK